MHSKYLPFRNMLKLILTIVVSFSPLLAESRELVVKAEQAFYSGDLRAAKIYYSELIQTDVKKAHYYLGLIEKMSSPEKRNNVSMLAHFKKAASLGHALAMWEIGIAYEAGDGVQMNQFVAMDWFRKSEQQPSLADDTVFFVVESNGIQTEYKSTEYLEFLLKQAQAGDKNAQFSVATFYDKGQFTDVDRNVALKWYLAAAQSGHVKAAATASYFYCRGIAGNKDLEKANYWAEKSNLTTQCEN